MAANRISLNSSFADTIEQGLIFLLFIGSIAIYANLGVVSISFPIGLILIFYDAYKHPYRYRLNKYLWLLLGFVLFGYISIVLSPLPFTLDLFKRQFQLIYWLMLSIIVANSYPYLKLKKLSQIIAFSVLCLIVFYYFSTLYMGQNSVAFSLVIMGPLGCYGFKKQWIRWNYMMILWIAMLFNESRSGLAILTVEIILLIAFYTPIIRKYVIVILLLFISLAMLLMTESIRTSIGEMILPYNVEFGELMIDPDYVNRNDKSWLTRKVQVQKGLQIFGLHPILGIGPFNFASYDINIDFSQIDTDLDLTKVSGFDNRSAHNSYINILSENGVIGFLLFFGMIIIIFSFYWRNFFYFRNNFETCVLVVSLGFLVYFYTISTLYGTSTWLIYGLMIGVVKKINLYKKYNQKPNKNDLIYRK